MKVELLVRGRFETLEAAKTKSVGPNVWELEIPHDDPGLKRARMGRRAEDWDGAVFAIDGVESEPAVGSGDSERSVRVTVYLLG